MAIDKVKEIIAKTLNYEKDTDGTVSTEVGVQKIVDIEFFRMLQLPVEQKDIDDVEQDYSQDQLAFHKAVGVLDEDMVFLGGFQFFYSDSMHSNPIGYRELTYQEFEEMAISSSLGGYGAIGKIDWLIVTPKITTETIGAQLSVGEFENDVFWDLRYVDLLGNNPFNGSGNINFETVDDVSGFYFTFNT